KNFLERPVGRGILRDASPLGTFPDIQPVEGCDCSTQSQPSVCLRTPACRPTVQAFIARSIADHERAAFGTRRGVFLQAKGETLFSSGGCGIQRPALRRTVSR